MIKKIIEWLYKKYIADLVELHLGGAVKNNGDIVRENRRKIDAFNTEAETITPRIRKLTDEMNSYKNAINTRVGTQELILQGLTERVENIEDLQYQKDEVRPRKRRK